MKVLIGRLSTLLLLVVLLGPALVSAQPSFPQGPVRIIDPFPPGTAIDTIGRLMAKSLTPLWGQGVIVENRSGAGGALGTGLVAHAQPDGQTLLVTSQSPLSIVPALRTVNYDPLHDFEPVWGLRSSGLVLVVNNDLPVHTVAELVQLAKAHPGSVRYATSGVGTVLHLAGERFIFETKAPMLHVPYRGGAPATLAVISGEAQVLFDGITNQLPNIRSGKLRALAVLRPTRTPLLPDVPTAAEAGVPDLDATGWFGVFAPRGTPDPVLAVLRRDAATAMREPEVLKRLQDIGLAGEQLDAAELDRVMRADIAQTRAIVKAANIHLEAE
jgi:tripartite-type tricarboxylate transporter receptor subunit TctC